MSNEMFDLAVAGGGPAGLAAALAARQRGLTAAVADPGQPPIDKACGEGLLPDSLAALRALGVDPPLSAGFPFVGIRFLSRDAHVDARFPQGPGLGIRRTVLHQMMAGRAAQAGVQLLWRRRVTGLSSRGLFLGAREIPARWIAGADGQNSRVRKWAGLDATGRPQPRFGFRLHYSIQPWTDFVEVYWCDGAQIYVTPVAHNEVCVVVLSRDPHLRLEAVLPRFPALHARLKSAPTSSAERGAVSLVRRIPRVASSRVALIGDASGSVDAVTGFGLGLAFRHAHSLAAALHRGRLDAYNTAHRRLMRRPALMSSLLLTLDRVPLLRRRVLTAFREHPNLFEIMLSMHVGEISAAAFTRHALLPLGWRLLTA
jgi:flavin-dependent dehydrogenase